MDDRLKDHLIKLADKHINSRDLAANLRPRDGQIIDREGRNWLIHAFEFVRYSHAFGTRRNDAAWLCGYDDDHLFVVRVPSTLKKVNDAIAWLKPAGADKEGTLRQGDLWFVPSRSGNIESLKSQVSGTRHDLSRDSEGRVMVTHPEHKTLTLANDKYKVLLGKRIVNGTSRKSHD